VTQHQDADQSIGMEGVPAMRKHPNYSKFEYLFYLNPMTRQNITSGSPYEKPIGFSRAVRIDNMISVSGTAPVLADGSTAFPGDLYNQTRYSIGIIENAIRNAGGKLENVFRTRIYLTDISRWEEAAKAHGEFFAEIRPASTFVEVSRLIKSDWLVEVEADCIV